MRIIHRDSRRSAELQRSRVDLAEALAAARQAAEARTAFLALMSHEIRTPLNSVIGASQLMLGTQLDAEQRDYAHTILNGGDTLLSLVNNILDLTKIDAGKMDVEPEDVDVGSVIEDVLDVVAFRAREKRLELTYHIDPSVPDLIRTDRNRLRQILVNLAGNSVKFTESGFVSVSVSCTPAPMESFHLEFRVSDTGPGIKADAQAQLFEPFSRTTSSVQGHAGTGLGLSISRKLAELLGGSIWLEQRSGAGATFAFRIPLEAAEEQPPAPGAAQATILVVASSADLRSLIQNRLPRFGFAVAAEPSASEAMHRLSDPAVKIAAVAIDVSSAELDGIELARQIRALRGCSVLPLLALSYTSRAQMESPDAALFSAHMLKPVRVRALYRTIKYMLQYEKSEDTQPWVDFTCRDSSAAPIGSRVLVAEDNDANRNLTLKMLRLLGIHADGATNGMDVIQELDRRDYDVIFMDVNMPRMDGIEATRRIRRRNPSRQPWIAALTANATYSERERCLVAGMDYFITKPIVLRDLEIALKRSPCWPKDELPSPTTAQPQDGATHQIKVLLDDKVVQSIRQMYADDPRELQRIVDVFFHQTRMTLADLEHAVQRGDAAAVAKLAHRVKGGAASFGARMLHGITAELEADAAAGALHEGDRLLQMFRECSAVTERYLRPALLSGNERHTSAKLFPAQITPP